MKLNISNKSKIDNLIRRGKKAQKIYSNDLDQKLFDEVCLAVGWSILKKNRNNKLSELAVIETGFGNKNDKITKNERKTIGLLNDLKDLKTTGIIYRNKKGITKIYRPIGLIGSLIPSTNPIATPLNNIINSLKCGNSIILSPSPKGYKTCKLLIKYIHEELKKFKIPLELVQMLPDKPSFETTKYLIKNVDRVIVTGNQKNVRYAYSSGTPSIGAGVGNVTSIIDETANLKHAAKNIFESKTFDFSTSCSSENSLIIMEAVYENFLNIFKKKGCLLLGDEEKNKLEKLMWDQNTLKENMVAKDPKLILKSLKIDSSKIKILLVEENEIGKKFNFSREKLNSVLTIYKKKTFKECIDTALEIYKNQGAGHSIGIHTSIKARQNILGLKIPACRVIVNQNHSKSTGGSFENNLPFSLSMGCGSWGKNSTDSNLNWRHFCNKVVIVNKINKKIPTKKNLFNSYWKKYGKK